MVQPGGTLWSHGANSCLLRGGWQVFDVGWILNCPAAFIYEASHFFNERQSVQEQGVVWEVGEGLGGNKWVNGQSSLLRIQFLNCLGYCKKRKKRLLFVVSAWDKAYQTCLWLNNSIFDWIIVFSIFLIPSFLNEHMHILYAHLRLIFRMRCLTGGEGYMTSLCIISYNFIWIYYYLKIK